MQKPRDISIWCQLLMNTNNIFQYPWSWLQEKVVLREMQRARIGMLYEMFQLFSDCIQIYAWWLWVLESSLHFSYQRCFSRLSRCDRYPASRRNKDRVWEAYWTLKACLIVCWIHFWISTAWFTSVGKYQIGADSEMMEWGLSIGVGGLGWIDCCLVSSGISPGDGSAFAMTSESVEHGSINPFNTYLLKASLELRAEHPLVVSLVEIC